MNRTTTPTESNSFSDEMHSNNIFDKKGDDFYTHFIPSYTSGTTTKVNKEYYVKMHSH